MAMVLRGAEVALALNEKVACDVAALRAAGVEPRLAIVRVGERRDDISYERGATKRAEKLGVAVKNVLVPVTASTDELVAIIEDLNADASVHGVLLFRPLPGHIDEDFVCNTLAPAKDIDGITDLSLAGVFAGKGTGFAPCTPSACMEILKHYGIDVKGRRAVVIGRSLVGGKPAAQMLLDHHATVTIAHSRTVDLPAVVREADIVVACVGCAQMVDRSYLRAGQVIIDVGINVADDGRLLGDVDFEAAVAVVQAVTPVPDGVGVVTTSVLIKHVVEAAQKAVG
ncbi:MAG: bifunctional 5,10-methylenetetrahydrofolate dehydrogenase/5,10-methenyltetrahydrofolate cyclohydrolase [Coriobacteriales bacterium]|jgi:methylenetetrahydrofolate dehydrogenase (NADP+)/methenyltetrahydrofolate cyclohydrolase|nr:bifunctional 5,10-methylenetetrahydrofolate dehydrogenase/5,10-methenyltetrahydrofolate cyclohydrolase [Coriobacteriales bacterium]